MVRSFPFSILPMKNIGVPVTPMREPSSRSRVIFAVTAGSDALIVGGEVDAGVARMTFEVRLAHLLLIVEDRGVHLPEFSLSIRAFRGARRAPGLRVQRLDRVLTEDVTNLASVNVRRLDPVEGLLDMA